MTARSNFFCYIFFATLLLVSQVISAPARGAHEHSLRRWFKAGNYVGVTLGAGQASWWAETGEDDLTKFFMAKKSSHRSHVLYGAFVGKDVNHWLSVEFAYKRFPDTTLQFSNDFNLPNSGSGGSALQLAGNSIESRTEQYAGLLKFRFTPYQKITLYTLLGASLTKRQDVIAKIKGYGFEFGFGLYRQFSHIRLGSDFSYATGQSKLVADSIRYYVPFLLDVSINLSYVF